jgi:hypothetical protein
MRRRSRCAEDDSVGLARLLNRSATGWGAEREAARVARSFLRWPPARWPSASRREIALVFGALNTK